ncbi:thiamine pyrophosphate-dependent enzyme [Cellulomonas iranensis]|uniref:Thiamine pyrophosphate enzyme TPP-binding domain-containing protein n=1 Tax=Cellulomonas iranensis TaxID=76862 RepID=A0ABU0GH26_9CELL|nr:thiamine pyrophosphate-dependent enzyme [Cellulomonas iranensis]MDQ0424646.1 hypothetical protein [Cellulomonas iranensis]
MQYRDVFAALGRALPDALYVSTCGYVSRDLFNAGDRPGTFYLVGSMGMAAPVATGIALALPGRTVVAIDGDGSFAMNLSGALTAAVAGARLVHVVLDNGRHQSTGGQRTVPVRDPLGLARSLGYRRTLSLDDPTRPLVLDTFPAFVHARVDARDAPVGPRITLTPHQLRDRFAAHAAATTARHD